MGRLGAAAPAAAPPSAAPTCWNASSSARQSVSCTAVSTSAVLALTVAVSADATPQKLSLGGGSAAAPLPGPPSSALYHSGMQQAIFLHPLPHSVHSQAGGQLNACKVPRQGRTRRTCERRRVLTPPPPAPPPRHPPASHPPLRCPAMAGRGKAWVLKGGVLKASAASLERCRARSSSDTHTANAGASRPTSGASWPTSPARLPKRSMSRSD